MNLDKLVAVSGKAGVYKMAANRSDGLILEDLDNGKKIFVSSRIHQFTPLESISIYTDNDDTVELKEVFRSMLTQLDTLPPVGAKADSTSAHDYFKVILPNYDRDQVFASDIKKIIKWFNFLNSRNLLSLENSDESTKEAKEETNQ